MGNFSKSLVFTLILLFGSDLLVSSENILVYCIVGSYSQRISIWPLLETLTEKGHNITYLSAFESKDPNPAIHDYTPKLWKERMGPWEEHIRFYDARKDKKMVKMWFEFPNLGIMACEALYEDEEFVNFVKTSNFDLVIMDPLMNECALGLVHYWKAKLIVYGTSTNYGWFYDQFGLPDETSSVSDLIFNFPRGKDMKFWQRFVNAVNPLYWKFLREIVFLPKMEEISRKGLGLEEIPSFAEIERNASFVMLTTHYSLEPPKSLPPNTIAIQGITVSKKLKPLPKEMTDFINKATEGFIYISFGTVAEFVNFEKEARIEFIKALEKFPKLKFLWKSTFPIEEKLPENVMVAKWVPQQTILAHPKIKAFISHMGMGSTTEAIHCSVPVICLPVLAEQDLNAHGIVRQGAGILLEITTLKENELSSAIREVVYNPKYKKAMERLSKIFKDRPFTGLEEALWWTEYVLRHDNPHEILRPLSVEQTWWVKRNIDVWLTATGIVLTVISLVLYVIYAVLRKVLQFSSMETGKKNVKVKRN